MGQVRSAIARGFVPPLAIVENPGPLAAGSGDPRASCTYRTAPEEAARDALPATCVPFDTAVALCRFLGHDLPTEAQWEYAATVAGRLKKTRYPWGESPPTCAGVVFARFDQPSGGDNRCLAAGFPFGLGGAGSAPLDVTPSGVRGLGGTVREWVRGAPLPYDAACSLRAGLRDPLCEAGEGDRLVRGGGWDSSPNGLDATLRGTFPRGGTSPLIGFRCVHGP